MKQASEQLRNGDAMRRKLIFSDRDIPEDIPSRVLRHAHAHFVERLLGAHITCTVRENSLLVIYIPKQALFCESHIEFY